MTNNGLKLCAHFAQKPNALKYCGQESAVDNIATCIIDGNCSALEEEFSHFKALNPYLKTFSEVTGKKLFDKDSIEAYWIGNSLLDSFKRDDFDTLMKNFLEQNIPDFFVEDLKNKFHNSKMDFIPHHSFNVLFIGVGNITGSVKYNLENINNCLIRFGKILEITNENIKANVIKLEMDEDESIKILSVDETFFYDERFFNKLNIGDLIATHWKSIAYKLNNEEYNNLEKYTKKVLEIFNKFLKEK